MTLNLRSEQIEFFLSLTPGQQRELIAGMTPVELLALDADFEIWAHRAQLPPKSDGWRVWLMMAGRGFGKTRAGAEWVHRLARKLPARIAIVGATIAEARSIMVEGASGILSVARKQRHHVRWEPSLGQLRWPGGAMATLYSGDNADGLRGPEHAFAWCDELAKWRQGKEAWDNLQMGLRGGPRARALVTTTPRPIQLIEKIMKLSGTVVTGGRTRDNINLPREFVDAMIETYGGTRLGRQELDGELIPELEGALWTRELLELARRPLHHPADGPPPRGKLGEDFRRIVVGVDPPASVGEGCDACGIVVCGLGHDGMLTVLADESVAGLSPEGWSNRVAAAAARWGAARVVAEANNGGAMVDSVLKAADSGLRVRLVHAAKGKSARAEPVALKFEAGKARLAGSFPELEAELCGLIAGGGRYEGPGNSPDRADAMVWAMTDLMETRSGVPRVARL